MESTRSSLDQHGYLKSPLLHQCRLHSNGNDFKIVQKSIQSSSNLQEANHRGMSTISS